MPIEALLLLNFDSFSFFIFLIHVAIASCFIDVLLLEQRLFVFLFFVFENKLYFIYVGHSNYFIKKNYFTFFVEEVHHTRALLLNFGMIWPRN